MLALIGVAVGLISAMPLGPISAMAISYRLKGCHRESRAVALVAAVCDCAYVLLAGAASGELAAVFERLGPWMLLGGGLLLAGIAVSFFVRASRLTEDMFQGGSRPRSVSPVLLTFVLYVGNPTIIVYWIALLRAVTTAGYFPVDAGVRFIFAASVGFGSWLWFGILAVVLQRSRDRLGVTFLRTILRFLGVLLAAFALRSLVLGLHRLIRF